MILQLKAPKFIYRGKNREIWEVDFNPEESIFYRDVALTELKKKSLCRSCKYEFRKASEMVLCTFCTLSACKNCALKTRPFP